MTPAKNALGFGAVLIFPICLLLGCPEATTTKGETTDASTSDATTGSDSTFGDTAPLDTAHLDTTFLDSPAVDAHGTDMESLDSAAPDRLVADSQSPDVSPTDRSQPDLGPCETDTEFCASQAVECGQWQALDNCNHMRRVDCGGCQTGSLCRQNQCTPSVCTPTGWCYTQPYPQANSIKGISASGDDDVWLVGQGGLVLQYDGNAIFSRDVGSTETLNDVWAESASSVWVVGWQGTVLHYNGTDWTALDPGPSNLLTAVHGTSSSDVWIAEGTGEVHRFNGTDWSTQQLSSDLHDIWVASPTEAFAVGGTEIHHYSNGSWSPVATDMDTTPQLRSVWGSSASDVWVVGDYDGGSSTILHFLGSQFQRVTSNGQAGLNAIWGRSADDIWAAGTAFCIMHYSGGSWTQVVDIIPGGHLHAVGGGASEVWFAGHLGRTARWQDNTLLHLSPQEWEVVHDIWGSGNDIWAVSDYNTTLQWDGQQWQTMGWDGNPSIEHLWGLGSGELYGLGEMGVFAWTDLGWQPMSSPTLAGESFNAIWAGASDNIWIGATSAYFTPHIFHYNGTDWTEADTQISGTGYGIHNIWGTSSTDVWFVTGRGLIHYTGAGYEAVENTGSLFDIFGFAQDDIWAVGDYGKVLRYNGTQWQEQMSDRNDGWIGVWGTSSTDLYVISRDGILAHYDGAWTYQDTGIRSYLQGMWGSSDGDLWVRGSVGTLAHRAP